MFRFHTHLHSLPHACVHGDDGDHDGDVPLHGDDDRAHPRHRGHLHGHDHDGGHHHGDGGDQDYSRPPRHQALLLFKGPDTSLHFHILHQSRRSEC